MRKIKALVKNVSAGSPAAKAGLISGDMIEGVDGYGMLDILDWKELTSDCSFSIQVLRAGKPLELHVERVDMSDLGVEFEDILFDGIRECANKCVFCFVDQLPQGVRESLCVKDDDYRLSFLQGNFVTLTNCSIGSLDRIVEFRMSPLYISIHATDPIVRNRLLGRKSSKPIMDTLAFLGSNGIEMHTQIVIVPGINDEQVLTKSINDLAGLFPSVRSVGIVPVGLTKHRKTADSAIEPVSPQVAAKVLDVIESIQARCWEKLGTRFVWAADEFYIRAGRHFPEGGEYEGYVQLENGIGLARSLYDDLDDAVEGSEWAPDADSIKDLVITGLDGAEVLRPVFKALRARYGYGPSLLAVRNSFFGDTVTVTGLLVGRDIIDEIKSAHKQVDNTRRIIIPDTMLRRGDNVFLDGTTPADITAETGIEVVVVGTNAEGVIDAAGLELKGGAR